MAKIEFTPSELKAYFTNKKLYHYCNYARMMEKQMRIHADGHFPEKLINERRPNEPEDVLEYRKKIWVPKTKPYFSKIETTLQKIRRSTDWSIKYPNNSFDRIMEGEKLQDYAEKNFPIFGSITNWAFSLLLRNYLIDSNAVLLVAPIELPMQENEYLKPVATIFASSEILDFQDNDYLVAENKAGCIYNGNKPGKSYYIVTTVAIYRYDQINSRGDFSETYYYEHNLGLLPCFKLGGIVIEVHGMHTLYDSRISGILPEFNEALREYSDLQAAKVLHLYPERWEYTQNECTACKGSGQRIEGIGTDACQVTCKTCNGHGYIATGPYSKMLIKPAPADQLQLPTPPAGFVEKDVEIIKLQEESINSHLYQALAAINFEFLAATPLNQSGTAKEVDKDELNTTVHAIAEDLIRIIDNVYFLIALYRYSSQYSIDDIYSFLPKVAVPEKFDILGTAYYDAQMKSAKDSKLNPAIINALEVVYATKAFNNDLQISQFVELILKLDPLAGISEDDKMSRLSNNGITQLDYVVSSNINKFVSQAIDTVRDFEELDTMKQKEIIYEIAQAQINANRPVIIDIDA